MGHDMAQYSQIDLKNEFSEQGRKNYSIFIGIQPWKPEE
jgi:hypothetical protein